MSRAYKKSRSAKAVVELLSTKAASEPHFNESEQAAIARYLKATADPGWAAKLRTLDSDLRRELALTAQPTTASTLRDWCDDRVISPPYTFGHPLVEEAGNDAKIFPPESKEGDGPSSKTQRFVPVGLKTYAQLAVPNEGILSLGVGLGKARAGSWRTVHPPSKEIPQSFPVPGGVLEVTQARASLGYLATDIPPPPIQGNIALNVTVHVTVGDPPRPFYLFIPPVRGADQTPFPFLLQAFGSASLVVLTSGQAAHGEPTLFLERQETITGPIGSQLELRDLSLSQSLLLERNTRWVFVAVEVRLAVQRWFVLPPPPLSERAGFVMIDLRSPEHSRQVIHSVLGAGGPVRIPQISMTFCPIEIFPPLEDEI